MKIRLPHGLFLGLAAGAAMAPWAKAADYVTTVTSLPNLVGYWRFDAASGTNSLVNGYTGVSHGAAQISAAGLGCPIGSDPGNQALVLDGNNSNPSYLSTSLTGQITNQGSVLVWVYLTAQPATLGHFFQITSQARSGDDFDFQLQTDNHLYFFTDSGSATSYNQPLTLNQWHFLAATFIANSTRALYLDGQLVASGTAGNHSGNGNPLWIGNNSVFGPRCFAGRLDEVAIFSRALTASEIANVYAVAGAPSLKIATSANGTVLTWPTNYTGYVLQTNRTPDDSNWGTLVSNPGSKGSNFVHIINLPDPLMFFRLQHP